MAKEKENESLPNDIKEMLGATASTAFNVGLIGAVIALIAGIFASRLGEFFKNMLVSTSKFISAVTEAGYDLISTELKKLRWLVWTIVVLTVAGIFCVVMGSPTNTGWYQYGFMLELFVGGICLVLLAAFRAVITETIGKMELKGIGPALTSLLYLALVIIATPIVILILLLAYLWILPIVLPADIVCTLLATVAITIIAPFLAQVVTSSQQAENVRQRGSYKLVMRLLYGALVIILVIQVYRNGRNGEFGPYFKFGAAAVEANADQVNRLAESMLDDNRLDNTVLVGTITTDIKRIVIPTYNDSASSRVEWKPDLYDWQGDVVLEDTTSVLLPAGTVVRVIPNNRLASEQSVLCLTDSIAWKNAYGLWQQPISAVTFADPQASVTAAAILGPTGYAWIPKSYIIGRIKGSELGKITARTGQFKAVFQDTLRFNWLDVPVNIIDLYTVKDHSGMTVAEIGAGVQIGNSNVKVKRGQEVTISDLGTNLTLHLLSGGEINKNAIDRDGCKYGGVLKQLKGYEKCPGLMRLWSAHNAQILLTSANYGALLVRVNNGSWHAAVNQVDNSPQTFKADGNGSLQFAFNLLYYVEHKDVNVKTLYALECGAVEGTASFGIQIAEEGTTAKLAANQ